MESKEKKEEEKYGNFGQKFQCESCGYESFLLQISKAKNGFKQKMSPTQMKNKK